LRHGDNLLAAERPIALKPSAGFAGDARVGRECTDQFDSNLQPIIIVNCIEQQIEPGRLFDLIGSVNIVDFILTASQLREGSVNITYPGWAEAEELVKPESKPAPIRPKLYREQHLRIITTRAGAECN